MTTLSIETILEVYKAVVTALEMNLGGKTSVEVERIMTMTLKVRGEGGRDVGIVKEIIQKLFILNEYKIEDIRGGSGLGFCAERGEERWKLSIIRRQGEEQNKDYVVIIMQDQRPKDQGP